MCRGGAGWAVSRHCPALLAALWVVVAALQEWCSWEEGPPFRSPPARRETHTRRTSSDRTAFACLLSLAFDVRKQSKADMAYRSRAHRHPAHPPHTRRPRARPTPAGRKGSDSLGWQQNEYVESWLNNAERNESRPAHKSGSRAPTDRSTALATSAPLLPTHPPRLGPRRAISGDLALSRAISGPRRAISGDLGASLARRHTCSKKEGPGWSHGAHEDVLARFSPPRPAPLGPVRRRPARRVPRPVTPTPARTAHLQPSWGYSCAHAGEPGGTPFPPPPTG